MSWQSQLRSAISSISELEQFLDCPLPTLDYPVKIPVKFATRIKNAGKNSALWKQFIPSSQEQSSVGLSDPIGDATYCKTPGLIHRYNNRALLTPTRSCPVICRYCFRKNELYTDEETLKFRLNEAIAYLSEHTEVNEVILTGGDPLMLSDDKLLKVMGSLAQLNHIKFMRIHTRFPIVIEQRLDSSFLNLCLESKKRFKRFFLTLHINHPQELSEELKTRIFDFHLSGIEILSQTVLLKGVNDDTDVLLSLYRELSEIGVTPYYLHHPDLARGTSHFWLTLEQGRKIYADLRNKLSGWALPEYIIDIPSGFGKTPAYNPEGYTYSGKLLDRKGRLLNVNLDKI